MWRSGSLVVAAVATLIVATSAAAHQASRIAEPGSAAILQDCQERSLLGVGDEGFIRSIVPARYQLARDLEGRPLIGLLNVHCDRVTLDGTTEPSTLIDVVAVIASPDGQGCLSRGPLAAAPRGDAVPLCNFFILRVLTDDPRVVSWETALMPDLPVRYEPALQFAIGEFDPMIAGAPVSITTPSLSIRAAARLVSMEAPVLVRLWWEGSQGGQRIDVELNARAVGLTSGTAHTTSGSDFEQLFGGSSLAGVHGSPPTFAAATWDGIATRVTF